jgi:cell division protein FtsA
MHGYRLEVEAHIITAAAATVENLRQCVEAAGVSVVQFVLNPLASAEVVLNDTERQMGAVVVDIGGGTTDMAIYIEGDIWHTAVIPVGGNLITSDIAQGIHLPITVAEDIKKQYGYAIETDVDASETFSVRSFGEEKPVQVSRKDLAMIIEARVAEIFDLVLAEIKRSGYDGLLPAGVVLTGGVCNLPGIRSLGAQLLRLPVQISKPENLIGLVDQLHSPAYSTSVGLLYWALIMNDSESPAPRRGGSRLKPEGETGWEKVTSFLRSLLP